MAGDVRIVIRVDDQGKPVIERFAESASDSLEKLKQDSKKTFDSMREDLARIEAAQKSVAAGSSFQRFTQTILGGVHSYVNRLSTGIDMIKSKLASIGPIGALLGGAGFMMFAKQVMAASQQMEAFTAQYKTLYGRETPELGAAALQRAIKFSAETPFEMPEVIQAQRMLKVMTDGALDTADALSLVGDVSAGVGRRIDELSIWFGRLYTGMKTHQIGEPMMRLTELGVVTGETRMQLEKMMKAGTDADKMWTYFTGSLGKFKGLMDEMSTTVQTRLSNMSDWFWQFKIKIGEKVFEALRQDMGKFLDKLDSPTWKAAIEKIETTIANALLRVYQVVKTLFKFFYDNARIIQDILAIAAAVLAVRAAIALVTSPITLVVASLVVLVATFRSFGEEGISATKGITEGLKVLVRFLAQVAAYYDFLTDRVGSLVAAARMPGMETRMKALQDWIDEHKVAAEAAQALRTKTGSADALTDDQVILLSNYIRKQEQLNALKMDYARVASNAIGATRSWGEVMNEWGQKADKFIGSASASIKMLGPDTEKLQKHLDDLLKKSQEIAGSGDGKGAKKEHEARMKFLAQEREAGNIVFDLNQRLNKIGEESSGIGLRLSKNLESARQQLEKVRLHNIVKDLDFGKIMTNLGGVGPFEIPGLLTPLQTQFKLLFSGVSKSAEDAAKSEEMKKAAVMLGANFIKGFTQSLSSGLDEFFSGDMGIRDALKTSGQSLGRFFAQGMSDALSNKLEGVMGGLLGSKDKEGNIKPGPLGKYGGFAMAGLSLVAAAQSKGGIGGSDIGAALGMGIGTLIGPVGTMLGGAVGGLIGGLFDKQDEQNREQTEALREIARNTNTTTKELMLLNRNFAGLRTDMAALYALPSSYYFSQASLTEDLSRQRRMVSQGG